MPSDSDNDDPPALVALGTSIEFPYERAEVADGSTAAPLGRAAPPPLPATSANHRPVPVCLITGFLGAGKSTLINYILTAKHGYRCAVLLNEWADSADIEKALIKDPEGAAAAPVADWVQLENGCICCSVKSDMVKALEALLQQRERFDYILIETTGLANPGPVAAALWTDAELESGVCLDAIVTVVDARLIHRQLAEPRPAGAVNEAQQQVAFADVILLNKTDLVTPEQLAAVEAELRDVNSEAGVVPCRRCEIDLALILDTGIYSAGSRDPAVMASAGGEEAGAETGAGGDGHSHGPQCGRSCSHASHSAQSPHHHQVGTVTLFADAPLNLRRLRHWLDELLWEDGGGADAGGSAAASIPPAGAAPQAAAAAEVAPRAAGQAAVAAAALAAAPEPLRTPDIMRVKGLLHVADSCHKLVLQGVHELYDVVEGPAWAEGEQRRTKLVFIGRRLDASALRAGLDACAATEEA